MLDLAVLQVFPDARICWFAENDPAASKVLATRFPEIPNLGDITRIDYSKVEPVDLLTAGFPCTDVSAAGQQQGMTAGTRSGLWSKVAEAIDYLRPGIVYIENVLGLFYAISDRTVEPCSWCVGNGPGESVLRAFPAVLGDLYEIGYNARWEVVSAATAGAPHRRERVFICAFPNAASERSQRSRSYNERQAA